MPPVTLAQALSTALGYHQAGNFSMAESIYRQILARDPNHADALHLQGVIAHQLGRHEEAVEMIGRAISIAPGKAAYHYNLGAANQAREHLDEAAACFQRALALKPDYAEAHNNLGTVYFAKGLLDEAVASYNQALSIKPDFADAHYNLGGALRDQGLLSDAQVHFERASLLNPDSAETHYHLGGVLREEGLLDDAIVHFEMAASLKPDFVDAYNSLAGIFQRKGLPDQAIDCYNRVLATDPVHYEARHDLGLSLAAKGRYDEAVVCFNLALALKPGQAEVHHNLGNALGRMGRFDQAIASLKRAMALNPGFSTAHSSLVYFLLFHPGYDAGAILEEHRRWNSLHGEPLKPLLPPTLIDPDPDRRLRIGYVSPDFRDHVVGRNILPLFRCHDHGRFEIFSYSNSRFTDSLTNEFLGFSDHWREIADMSDDVVAHRIAEDRIDILVDLSLHTTDNRLLLFARKPAPVQVTFAGYPGTTGLDAIDYRLTDPYLDPPGTADEFYSEESIRLPHSFWCYDPLERDIDVNPLPAVEAGFITFGSFNNFCKFNDPCLRLWAQVLKAVDGSRLLLLVPQGDNRSHILELLWQEEIRPERIEFADFCQRPDYLKLYHRIDLGLDTLPYNGHTTSLDSLWMGVPVVTLVGRTVSGRGGLSQLTNLGFPELIAHEPEEFVEIAVGFARDLPRLAALRSVLRQRMEHSPLMDAPRFTRGIEDAYRTMWQRKVITA